MTTVTILIARVRAMLTRRRLEHELDEELRSHLELSAAEHIRRGLSPEAARARARRDLGCTTHVREQWRDARGFTPLDDLLTDLRHGIRRLVARPAFAAVTLATLAIGIGANTAVFSLVHGVLLAPLPVADGERLVWLGAVGNGFQLSVSIPNYYSWEEQNRTFETIGARRNRSFTLTGGDRPERLPGAQVLGDFFGVLGIPPLLGRTIRADETVRGAPRLAVIGHDLWQQRYDGDPGVVGEAIVLSGEAFTVVGVMPGDFRFGAAQVWVPMGADETRPWEERGNSSGTYAVARMRAGVTFEQAVADMERVGRQVQADTGWPGMPTVTPLRQVLVGDLRSSLLVLFGAVGFVLLLACVNLANLLTARADARRREFAVRASLGAGRGRLVRQLLTESIVMALGGGLLGIALARGLLPALVSELPLQVVLNAQIGLDARVLLFTLVVSVSTGLLFGLLPAIGASGVSLVDALKGAGRGTGSAGGRGRIRSGLVVGELALALVLLIGAGLMLRSFNQLQAVDPGFRTTGIATMWVSLPDAEYTDTAAWMQFYERLLERVEALPGVRRVGMNNVIPLGTGGSESETLPDNRPVEFESTASALYQTVNGAYFEALGIPLLRGRTFDSRDLDARAHVAIVDETMAEAFWPGEDPIGRRVAFEFDGAPDNVVPTWRTVVGVVGHVRHYDLRLPSRVEIYVPFTQPPTYFDRRRWPMSLFVETDGDPTNAVGAVRDELARLDPNLPLHTVRTMDEILVAEVGFDRVLSGVLTIFALVALLLAAVGIYGVTAYSVSRRTHEIGVRMALGARAVDVVLLVQRRALLLIAAGLAIGLVSAAALSRAMSSVLFELSAGDPATFATVPTILATVALAAGWLPARRAARVDPLVALRCD
jgi:putative ABC transport system permease protein